LNPEQIKAAAELLVDNRLGLHRLDRLPDELRPQDEAAAYAIQVATNERLEAAFGRRAGWKIGCTTPTMQRYLNIPQPCAGETFERFTLWGEREVPYRCFVRPGVECEIAVELGRPLRAGERAADAVGAVMASIELVDDRYADYRSLDVQTLIADDFFNAGCCLGEPMRHWHNLDLAAIGGGMWINGMKVGAGKGADILGHPLNALAWLAGRLGELGRVLDAGTVVTLGSLVQTVWVEQGDRVEIEIEGLGTVAVRFV
jgi:2-oxo-3-hexenedioate decarboxylase/2-keto-4-pentenoate hydratase